MGLAPSNRSHLRWDRQGDDAARNTQLRNVGPGISASIFSETKVDSTAAYPVLLSFLPVYIKTKQNKLVVVVVGCLRRHNLQGGAHSQSLLNIASTRKQTTLTTRRDQRGNIPEITLQWDRSQAGRAGSNKQESNQGRPSRYSTQSSLIRLSLIRFLSIEKR